MPRPSLRTKELEQEILSRLAKGEPLAVICREEGKPHVQTWGDWCNQDESLKIAHARARDEGYDAIALDALAIADDGSQDYVDKIGPDGEVVGRQLNSEHVQRSKLRVETRLKLLAKWDPRRYGDKLAVGGDPDGVPIQTSLTVQFVSAVQP